MNYNFLFKSKSQILTLGLVASTCLFLGVLLTSFKSESEAQVALMVKKKLVQDVAFLQQQSKQFTHTLDLLQQNQSTIHEGQQAFYRVKKAYKQIEYLLEYLDPELAKNLNGAALPKVLVEEGNYQTLNFQHRIIRTLPTQDLQEYKELMVT